MINTLNELKVGDSGVVVSFKGKGSLRKHLMEMGFVKGANVEVQRVAPMGDPIEIKVKDTPYPSERKKQKISRLR